MSASAVRSAFRSEVATWAAAQGTPPEVVDTINRDAEPSALDVEWVTLSFQLDDVEYLTLGGSKYEETGTVTVSLFGPAGGGDAQVAALSTSLVAHFRAISSPLAGGVEVAVVSSIDDFANPGEVRGAWFGVDVDINYVLYS